MESESNISVIKLIQLFIQFILEWRIPTKVNSEPAKHGIAVCINIYLLLVIFDHDNMADFQVIVLKPWPL